MRLRGLTRFVCGDDRPKQFCPLLGEYTLLEETRQRAERSIYPNQILYSVTRAHQDYYVRDLADRPSQRIVQPCSRGTAPAILYTLLHIFETDPDAVVAILTCDHYYSPESAFTAALESAFTVADAGPESVVLLGAQPRAPEVEYGWIELGNALAGSHSGVFHVKCFQEKPPSPVAAHLFRTGSLWNTSSWWARKSLSGAGARIRAGTRGSPSVGPVARSCQPRNTNCGLALRSNRSNGLLAAGANTRRCTAG